MLLVSLLFVTSKSTDDYRVLAVFDFIVSCEDESSLCNDYFGILGCAYKERRLT